MGIKSLVGHERYEDFVDGWRNVYCYVISVVITAIYVFAYFKWEIKIWESINFADTLSSITTFVSIIISFFGVLLTLLISAKEKSVMIQDFLKSADKEAFTSAIKKLIMCGILTVLIAACLFMEDIISEKITVVLTGVGVYFLIMFTTLTYRFTNILLMLFIKDHEDFNKIEGNKLEYDKEQELIERINKGI